VYARRPAGKSSSFGLPTSLWLLPARRPRRDRLPSPNDSPRCPMRADYTRAVLMTISGRPCSRRYRCLLVNSRVRLSPLSLRSSSCLPRGKPGLLSPLRFSGQAGQAFRAAQRIGICWRALGSSGCGERRRRGGTSKFRGSFLSTDSGTFTGHFRRACDPASSRVRLLLSPVPLSISAGASSDHGRGAKEAPHLADGHLKRDFCVSHLLLGRRLALVASRKD
jgi:hypothetical protein